MTEFKLTHPWRWRVWMCCIPFTIPFMIVVCGLHRLTGSIIAEVDLLVEWCRAHEYVISEGVASGR